MTASRIRMINSNAYYLDIFGVDDSMLDRLTEEGLRSGGSYCDLFFENTTYGSLLLRDGAVTSGGNHVDFGVGILPYPKYDTEQEDYISLDWGGLMGVPGTIVNTEMVGAVIELLAYESADTVIPAYYDVLLSGKLARDDLLHEALSRELLVLLRVPLELRLVIPLLLLLLDLFLHLAQDLHEVSLGNGLEQVLFHADLDRLSCELKIVVARNDDYLRVRKLL